MIEQRARVLVCTSATSDQAAATPATRDRWVDTLRVGSLLVVVLGTG